jgi:hypothetical protein
MTNKGVMREGIELNFYRLPWVHLFKLDFFEVGNHPVLVIYDSKILTPCQRNSCQGCNVEKWGGVLVIPID